MLIRSQDRNYVVPLKSCECVYVSEKQNRYTDEKSYLVKAGFNDKAIVLGEYGTEERAKEVLEEIVVYYSLQKVIEIDKVYSPLGDAIKKRYEGMVYGCYDMPEE